MSGRLQEFDRETLLRQVESNGPVLVHFGTDWCAPCKRLERVLLQLASSDRLNISLGKVNVEDHPQLATEFSISKNPTLCLFNGKTVKRKHEGFLDHEQVLRFVGGDADQ